MLLLNVCLYSNTVQIYKIKVILTSLLNGFLLSASDLAPLIFIPSENKRCNKIQMNQMSE